MGRINTSPAVVARFVRALSDDGLATQLELAERKEQFDARAAKRFNRDHTPAPLYVALRAESENRAALAASARSYTERFLAKRALDLSLVKSCASCERVIPISTVICPFCGGEANHLMSAAR